MKNWKKLIAGTMAGVMALALTACGGGNTGDTAKTDSDEVYRTLDEIKASGTINIGVLIGHIVLQVTILDVVALGAWSSLLELFSKHLRTCFGHLPLSGGVWNHLLVNVRQSGHDIFKVHSITPLS